MFLQKLHELISDKNDIFRLTNLKNMIIVNHDYEGIDLLNDSLNLIKSYYISDNYITWAIYKKYNSNVIMIHNPSNANSEKHQFTFINLNTFEKTTANPGTLAHNCFSQNYYWKDNSLILISEEEDIFFSFDFEKNKLQVTPHEKVKHIAPLFFDFWQQCKKYKPITIYPEKRSLIYQKNHKSIIFLDISKDICIDVQLTKPNPCTVEYHNGIFLLEYSNKIEIIYENNYSSIETKFPYYYLATCILENNIIVTLRSNTNDHMNCILTTYQLQKSKCSTI